MKILSCMCLFATTLFLPQDLASQQSQKSSAHRFQDVRKAAHDKLLGIVATLKDDQILWSSDRKRIWEIIVFESEDKNFVNEKSQIELIAGAQDFARLFDQIVFYGEDLQDLAEIQLINESERMKYEFTLLSDGKQLNRSRGFGVPTFQDEETKPKTVLAFKMVPIHSSAPTGGRILINFKPKSSCFIKKVAFRSSRGIDRDFQTLKDYWETFPESASLQKLFFERTRNQSIDEINSSLRENSEFFLRIIAPEIMMTASSEFANINGVFADRRVAKLYSELNAMEPQEASLLAAQNFAREFEAFKEYHNDGDIATMNVRHALDAQLFLCSEFCPAETVLGLIDNWRSWHEDERDSRLYMFGSSAGPDFLFIVNLQVNMIAKQRGFSSRDTNRWMSESVFHFLPDDVSKPAVSPRWLLSYDWTPHRQDVITMVPVLQKHYTLRTPERQANTLKILRESILE